MAIGMVSKKKFQKFCPNVKFWTKLGKFLENSRCRFRTNIQVKIREGKAFPGFQLNSDVEIELIEKGIKSNFQQIHGIFLQFLFRKTGGFSKKYIIINVQ